MNTSTTLIAILAFTLVVIVVEAIIIVRSPHSEDDEAWEHENIVRFLGLTLIVGAILVLVVLDIKEERLTAVIGVLGTLAGYFLRPADKRGKARGKGEG